MFVFRLIPTLFLFLLLGGQVLLLSGQAYALPCCKCGFPCPVFNRCICCTCGVLGTLQSFGSPGTLKIDGLDETLGFTVDDKNLGLIGQLKKLKLNEKHQFSLNQKIHADGEAQFECVGVDKGLKDMTADFVDGLKQSKSHPVLKP